MKSTLIRSYSRHTRLTFYGGIDLQKFGGNPHKYALWWRGPYQVTPVLQQHGKSLVDKPRFNLVTDKEYVVDVTHIRPFYYDPTYVTPLNIVKETDETVVDMIV